MDTLLFIDSYLSDLKRASVCSDLIDQLHTLFPEYKIALLNKYPNSYNLESKVDYYFYYGDSIMVGSPPQDILDNKLYERGYVYVSTGLGVCENWVPLTGVTDHVAGIYNSFILSCRIAESLGFEKVFKLEYDTILDPSESQLIKSDLANFKDYILYGKRQEGQWVKPHHYLIDVHLIGYSTKIFKDIPLITNDDMFWDLCQTLGYFGKWIEYLIYSTIEKVHSTHNLQGITYNTPIKLLYPNSQFDVINSPSYWTQKWDNIPKVCRVSYDKGETEEDNEIALFFWNDKESDLEVNCTITNINGDIIYNNNLTLGSRHWFLAQLVVSEDLQVTNINTRDNNTIKYEFLITQETIKDSPTRFLYEN